jgi:hypothetical protein
MTEMLFLPYSYTYSYTPISFPLTQVARYWEICVYEYVYEYGGGVLTTTCSGYWSQVDTPFARSITRHSGQASYELSGGQSKAGTGK